MYVQFKSQRTCKNPIKRNNLTPGSDSASDCENSDINSQSDCNNSEIDSECDSTMPDQDTDMELAEPPESR
jgi:hypothetical protein